MSVAIHLSLWPTRSEYLISKTIKSSSASARIGKQLVGCFIWTGFCNMGGSWNGESPKPWVSILFWVNYNISPTWIKAIWGWFPLLTMIPVRSQWGRYNLPRYYRKILWFWMIWVPPPILGHLHISARQTTILKLFQFSNQKKNDWKIRTPGIYESSNILVAHYFGQVVALIWNWRTPTCFPTNCHF